MKFLARLCALVCAFSLSCAPVCAPSHQALAETLANETVALVELAPDLSLNLYCSAVWVSDREILTAAHCVSDVARGDSATYSALSDVADSELGDFHFAKLVDRESDLDLALLRADAKDLAPHGVAKLSTGDIRVGDEVFTMGHPAGAVWSFSRGDVAAIRKMGERWYVQATAPITPGSSGGGLYDDRGRLVGLTHSYVPEGENLNFFVHRDYIAAFLMIAHAGDS